MRSLRKQSILEILKEFFSLMSESLNPRHHCFRYFGSCMRDPFNQTFISFIFLRSLINLSVVFLRLHGFISFEKFSSQLTLLSLERFLRTLLFHFTRLGRQCMRLAWSIDFLRYLSMWRSYLYKERELSSLPSMNKCSFSCFKPRMPLLVLQFSLLFVNIKNTLALSVVPFAIRLSPL